MTNHLNVNISLMRELNSDYMAIMVTYDIKDGINPKLSLQEYCEEVRHDSIQTWKEFYTRLEGNK